MQTLLVVDDDEQIVEMVQDFAELKGYEVLPATSPEEALRVLETQPGRIDLLITDVVMPGMSGRELSARLCASCPQTKVLYLSGYTEDAIVHEGVVDPDTAFLQKPFTLQMLARKVREVLGERG